MARGRDRACANCGMLVLIPSDEACPYCAHHREALALPRSLQVALRDWSGTMLRIQASPASARAVVGLVAVPAAIVLNAVAPWSSSFLVNAGLLVGLGIASFAAGGAVVRHLHRIPSPWRWVRHLPGFEGQRGPDAPTALREHAERMQTDLHLLDARLGEIRQLRDTLSGRAADAPADAAARTGQTARHLDDAIARLEGIRAVIVAGAGTLDHAVWRLQLRALRAVALAGGAGARGGLQELNALHRAGQQAGSRTPSRRSRRRPPSSSCR